MNEKQPFLVWKGKPIMTIGELVQEIKEVSNHSAKEFIKLYREKDAKNADDNVLYLIGTLSPCEKRKAIGTFRGVLPIYQGLPDKELFLYCEFLVEKYNRYFSLYHREYVAMIRKCVVPMDSLQREVLVEMANWADVLSNREKFDNSPWDEWANIPKQGTSREA